MGCNNTLYARNNRLGYGLEKKLFDEKITLQCWQYLLIFPVFTLLAVLVFLFVYRQFKLRSIAADIVPALVYWLSEFIKNEDVVELNTETKEGKIWPEFVLKR